MKDSKEMTGDRRNGGKSAKSIAYPDADLSCGLSTDGILICGDKKSIQRIESALHAQQGLVPYLREQLEEARAALAKATGSGS